MTASGLARHFLVRVTDVRALDDSAVPSEDFGAPPDCY